MGILSATTSVTRYRVKGELEKPIIDSIASGLQKYAVSDIDGQPSDQAVGWTSFQNPFIPVFEGSSFLIGTYILFSLRVDKKSIPPKLLQKLYQDESAKKLKDLERDFLSSDEKKAIKEHIVQRLNQKVPATPNIYDVVWQYEKEFLWFFSSLKSANEHLETLFLKTFGLHLIRQIPYTMALFDNTLSASQKDILDKLAFTEKEA